jgi:hypothetical protein
VGSSGKAKILYFRAPPMGEIGRKFRWFVDDDYSELDGLLHPRKEGIFPLSLTNSCQDGGVESTIPNTAMAIAKTADSH